MDAIGISKKLKAKFDLPREGFLEAVELQDAVGFSVYKIQKPGFRSLFRVYVKSDSLKDQDRLPLVLTASYGKVEGNGIIVASSSWKRGWYWPIELISRDEFFYDIHLDKLLWKRREIPGLELLRKINTLHTRPGLIFWLKSFLFRTVIPTIPIFVIVFYELISGNEFEESIWRMYLEEKTLKRNVSKVYAEKEEESRKLNIFGYQASRRSVFVYSIIHILIYFYIEEKDLNIEFVSDLLSSNLLTILYVIPTLGFFDRGLPEVLRYLIIKSIQLSKWSQFKEISI